MFVRTTWASDINHTARAALRELADADFGTVSAAPNGETDGVLNIQHQTALSLLRKGYIETVDAGRVAITREGLIKIGRITISRAERRRRNEAESLRAQASGEWQPVPAGYSAQAERDHDAARRAYAQAGAEVGEAREQLDWARDMLRTSREWGAEEAELKACREDVDAAEKRLAIAKCSAIHSTRPLSHRTTPRVAETSDYRCLTTTLPPLPANAPPPPRPTPAPR